MSKSSLMALCLSIAVLSGCSYHVMSKSDNKISENSIVAKSCSYAPLWLAPMNSDYANVEKIASKHHITAVESVDHVVYPYVLFTKSCLIVTGK